MSPLHVLQLVLAAAGAAVALPRRECRPVAAYLGLIVVLDASRFWLAHLLPAGPAEREGAAVLLRHASQAAYLAMILAVPAMSMAVFLRRWPWPVGVAFVAVAAYVVTSYPELRGAELLQVYTGLELAAYLASVGFFMMWLDSPRSAKGLSTPAASAITLTSAGLASVLLPQLTGPGTLAEWPVIVALHAVAFAIVLVLQLRALITPRQAAPRGRS